jgi:hypothetical protein
MHIDRPQPALAPLRRALSATVEDGPSAAAARADFGLALGAWRGGRADLVNDELAAAWLVMRIQSGDAPAFDLLDRAFRRGVHRYLCSILRNSADAEEVTQLVFMRALENIRSCRIASEPSGAWLYGIARHGAIDHMRKHTRVAYESPRRSPGGARAWTCAHRALGIPGGVARRR